MNKEYRVLVHLPIDSEVEGGDRRFYLDELAQWEEPEPATHPSVSMDRGVPIGEEYFSFSVFFLRRAVLPKTPPARLNQLSNNEK